MGKVIQIEVPDRVDEKLINKLKEMLADKILDEIGKDYADIDLYNLYLTLKFPKTEDVTFDTDKELEYLRKMKEKEKKRVWS